MATTIDKLFKGYTAKEIEEILFKPGFKAKNATKKRFPQMLKSQHIEKRVLAVWAIYSQFIYLSSPVSFSFINSFLQRYNTSL